jgi:hypothetical protein
MSKCFNFKHCSVVPQTERVPDMRAFITHSDILNILHAYVLTDLLTPWSRVLRENLTDSQLVNKYPAFYGAQRFIIAFTSAGHLSLS